MPDRDLNLTEDNGSSASSSPSPPTISLRPPEAPTASTPLTSQKPADSQTAAFKAKAATENQKENAEGKRSVSWVTDVVDGVSLERQLVDWLVAGRNYDLLKVKEYTEKQRMWERLAASWHQDGYSLRTAKQIQSKVDELIKKYKQACGYRDHTGQGVKENEGQQAFNKQLHKICKYYELFEECLGERSGFPKARKRQKLRANTKTTSSGPIRTGKPIKKAEEEEDGEDEADVEIIEEDKSVSMGRTRGKGKTNPVMDNLNEFLSQAAIDRKERMKLAKSMQEQKHLRKSEKDRLRKLKEFRALAEVTGKELAWEQILQQPFPTTTSQTTNATIANAVPGSSTHVQNAQQLHQFPLDPSLQDTEADVQVEGDPATSGADGVVDCDEFSF
ncbi:hypothetical protein QFC21_007213 [Naganishia friedmannii]|uniref:Uncharacterized protein n=1 Tax=Naganishia friedmannii TaxID=89922 RepID=A0ACC2UWZ5_9TREE|nr:hypothetical protein QFC21_007213 [Naganishia friedmannii]